ncbi:hypothetical protein BIFGAL_03489 [Bifidobacterium gallicum DSM 20093 = LMG 11596]|uniref:Uncharacterized protein n=1 Tax=Bifidobacterium gallicum DSM 20093 = LMG 11596 TaxID=561180 RepID=D1NUG6_9BIFI|nr:hypothetical protein BIFGAL_03489 [Bifidobacterium gallicum DSM 20093 = LMG 11596]
MGGRMDGLVRKRGEWRGGVVWGCGDLRAWERRALMMVTKVGVKA